MGYKLKVYRGATLIYNVNSNEDPPDTVQRLKSFTCYDAPAAGTYTYTVLITDSDSNPHNVSMRALSLLETKK